jgi:transposase
MSQSSMSRSRRSFSPEFKDELCREVIDSSKPISEVAKAYNVGDDSLRRWLVKYRDTHGGGPGLDPGDWTRGV